MDKTRDVRRAASRFSRKVYTNTNKKLSGHKFFSGLDFTGGDFVSLEKPKKEKVKRLSAVNGGGSSGNEDCEMGSCDLSDRENECPSQSQSVMSNGSAKRFKPPRKFFDECNGVDHASVPRKLRSAMKKRNRESASPPLSDSKKAIHTLGGVESPKRNGLKKPNMNLKQRNLDSSQKSAIIMPITKDEEEVVETLYALAEMFPVNDLTAKNKRSGGSLESKNPDLLEAKESPATPIEVKKEEVKSICFVQAAESAPSSDIEKSVTRAAEANSSVSGRGNQEQFDLLKVSRKTPFPSLANIECGDERPSCIHDNTHALPELSLETRLEQPKQQMIVPLERKPEIEFGVTAVNSQLAQEHTINEARNGLALWPGLSSTMPFGARSSGPSQTSATKNVSWLHAAICDSVRAPLKSSSVGKVPKASINRRPMKKCAAHVYISHLIQVLQMPQSKDNLSPPSIQFIPNEELKQGVLLPFNNFNGMRTSVNSILPSGSSCHSTAGRHSYNSSNRSLHLPYNLESEAQKAGPAPEMHESQKQIFDFLSLSTGGGGEDANNSRNNAVNSLNSQLQVPHSYSTPQHQPAMTFSIPQNRYSSDYVDHQLSATAAKQLPQHASPPFSGPAHTGHSGMTKQQQQIWATQRAAQYRAAGTSTSLNHFPGWQNSKQKPPLLVPSAQAAVALPPSSLGSFGSMYNTIPRHHQPFMTISSPHPIVKRQQNNLPAVYEETGGGFSTGGVLPLQLLCHERL